MKDNAAILFNSDWKFLLGDPQNAQKARYRDRTWKRVDLPHDWVISRPRDRGTQDGYTSGNMQGFFAWEGVCWYRKEFSLPDITEKEVYIYFGGAYRNSTVYINGREAGRRASGYCSFELDISGYVKKGKNLIAVRLDNSREAPERWYTGSGLYRNVYLKITAQARIKTWGVQVRTKLIDGSKQAEIAIETSVANRGKTGVIVHVRILGPDGSLAAEDTTPFAINGDEIIVLQRVRIHNPALWSAEKPNLYRALVYIETDGRAEKPVEAPFGIRDIKIVYNRGMFVNGERIKLKGVCLHHDAGITGSAYHDAVWRRRLLALKSIGCNAIRTSHNPPAEEFLDACDELGFYVIDEFFDKWKSGCYAAHFDADAHRDLTETILRDRSHPSVFMWPIGNEVENQGDDSMLEIQKDLCATVRSLDDRPVTCALQPHVHPKSMVGAPVEELVKITEKLGRDVDVLGLNYHEPLYQHYTAAIEKPIVGTECYEYYSSTAFNYEDITAKNPWQFVQESDNVAGQFIWAGIDYLGESFWPAKGWAGAILDICGFLKPNAYFRRSVWTDEPMVYLAFYDRSVKANHVRGRWSFPQMASHLNLDHLIGQTVKAAIFTNCDEVELWINGKKTGRRKAADFENRIIEWTFEYASGEVEVKGYREGREACSYLLKTAGSAKKLKLTPDSAKLKPGGIAHIEVNVVDRNGILCPNDDMLIEFALTGDGQILGACSPDLNTDRGFTLPAVVTSGGRALVLIRAGDSGGVLELGAYCGKLPKAGVRFKVVK